MKQELDNKVQDIVFAYSPHNYAAGNPPSSSANRSWNEPDSRIKGRRSLDLEVYWRVERQGYL